MRYFYSLQRLDAHGGLLRAPVPNLVRLPPRLLQDEVAFALRGLLHLDHSSTLRQLPLNERFFEPPHLLFEQTSLLQEGTNLHRNLKQELVCASAVVPTDPCPTEIYRFDLFRCHRGPPPSDAGDSICPGLVAPGVDHAPQVASRAGRTPGRRTRR